MVKGCGVSFWGTEIVLNLIVVKVESSMNTVKTITLHT